MKWEAFGRRIVAFSALTLMTGLTVPASAEESNQDVIRALQDQNAWLRAQIESQDARLKQLETGAGGMPAVGAAEQAGSAKQAGWADKTSLKMGIWAQTWYQYVEDGKAVINEN